MKMGAQSNLFNLIISKAKQWMKALDQAEIH